MQRKKKEYYFRIIYDQTYNELLNYVSKLYHYDPMMVEDILQETYLVLYKKLEQVLEHENPVGWLKTTAKFVTYHALEKKDIVQEILNCHEIDFVQCMEGLNEYGELSMFLSEKELQLVSQYYVDGYSLDELAKAYQISKSAMKMRIHRVVKKIKRSMAICLIFA